MGRCQIVKQDALLERKDRPFLLAQGGFDRLPLAVEPVHIPIEPILVELAKVPCFQNVFQRAAPDPVWLIASSEQGSIRRLSVMTWVRTGEYGSPSEPNCVFLVHLLSSLFGLPASTGAVPEQCSRTGSPEFESYYYGGFTRTVVNDVLLCEAERRLSPIHAKKEKRCLRLPATAA